VVWADITMDFIEVLPKVSGKSVILTVVDRFSKYVHFIPLSHPYTATLVAHVFFSDIVRLQSLPNSIVSDRDPTFTSQFCGELFKLPSVRLHMMIAFHPQADGQAEAVNNIVTMYLRCLSDDHPRHWVQWLPWTEFYYNSTFQSSLCISPFRVVYGRHPPVVLPYSLGSMRVVAINHQLAARNEFLTEVWD
jgi:transposase InsO family protein